MRASRRYSSASGVSIVKAVEPGLASGLLIASQAYPSTTMVDRPPVTSASEASAAG